MKLSYWMVCALLVAGVVAGPVEAQVSVVSNSVEEHVGMMGQEYGGAIRLRNTSAEPQEVKLYSSDYSFAANGETAYGAAGSTPRSNASWITIQPSRVTLPPNADVTVTYKVLVPASGAQRGTYWSIIMAEVIAKGSAESVARTGTAKGRELGIRSTIRYGIQVVTHMSEHGARTVDLLRAGVVQQLNGSKLLQFDVINTGERAYRPKLSAEFYDENGQLAARFENTRGLIYPGSSVQQAYELPAMKSGSYKVLIIADTGADQLVAAQYRLQL
jgi:hypothetical protein